MNIGAITCEFNNCNLIYENPITLPCGNTLCQSHLNNYNLQFVCCFCQKEHFIPQYGFGVNKAIMKMIDSFNQSNPIRKIIKESYEHLNQSIKEYEDIDPDVYVYEYFGEIRNQVDLHREELISNINARYDEIINQLKEKEQKCQQYKPNFKKVDLIQLKKQFMPTWLKFMRMTNKSQDELNNLLENINNKLEQIQNQTKMFKKDLLLGEWIEFRKYEKNNSFGELVQRKENSSHLSIDCGKLIREFDNNQHVGCIRSIQYDIYSNKMITASENNEIKIWRLDTGECLKTLTQHKAYVTCISIISNDQFASGSYDETIKIWNFDSYECRLCLNNKIAVASLCSISKNQIVCGSLDGSIKLWNLNNTHHRAKTIIAHISCISYLKLIGNSKLISASADRLIKIWSLDTFECINILEGHLDYISCLDLTLNDLTLISCSRDHTVKLWQLESGEMLNSIRFDSPVCSVKRLNHDLIAVGLCNGEIQIYDINKMYLIKTISAHSTFVFRLYPLSNGDLLSGSGNGEIKLWTIF